jgi:hypothetical protein
MNLLLPEKDLGQNDSIEQPRVAVMSVRNSESHVSRTCGYEFEDIICEELDFARLIQPAPGRQTLLQRQLRNFAGRRLGDSRILDLLNVGADKASLGADVELFFFSAAQPRDLTQLSLVPDWRDRSRFAVCWMQELWARDITKSNHLLDILNRFDHVICPFHHSIEALRQRLSVPVSFMPWGVDAELFCPFPNPPRRVIKVAGIGVVPKPTERALVRYADETGTFFHYQTIFGPSVAQNHREHRHNYAGILKRSEYFLCYLAKFTNTERGIQREFGLRYIEGVAAGTIMLGDPIDNPAFEEWFGWPDSIIPLATGDAEPEVLIRQLDADPERLAAARRNNLVHALLKLDNLYRWREILDLAGMKETDAMRKRGERLQALAEMVRASDI